MEISFQTKALRDTCESEELLVQRYGLKVAQLAMRRLADLRAAITVGDIAVGNPRIVRGSRAMRVDLCDGFEIIFRANHTQGPLDADGKLDWPAVKRIKIMKIGSSGDA
ncbi:MAG: hypothetical protein ACKVP3_24095 [Hyphomicrobiaceae bacterium]